MKKIAILLIVILVFSVLFYSGCNEKENNEKPEQKGDISIFFGIWKLESGEPWANETPRHVFNEIDLTENSEDYNYYMQEWNFSEYDSYEYIGDYDLKVLVEYNYTANESKSGGGTRGFSCYCYSDRIVIPSSEYEEEKTIYYVFSNENNILTLTLNDRETLLNKV